MTHPFIVVAGFGLGAWMARTVRRVISPMPSVVRTRYFATVAMFGAFALMPAHLVLYGLFPDWSLMYLANPAHLPNWLVIPCLALSCLGAPVAGFLSAHRILRSTERWPWPTMWALVGFAMFIIVVPGWMRLWTVAYYDAFHGSLRTMSLFRSTLFLPLILASAAVSAVGAHTLVRLDRHVRIFDESSLPSSSANGPR